MLRPARRSRRIHSRKRARLDRIESDPKRLARRAQAQAAREREQAARDELVRQDMRERVADWCAGGERYIGAYPDVLLRVRGDEIETSRGARIPVSHCARIWRVIQRVMQSGER